MLKLVSPEAETGTLQTWMRSQGEATFFSSQLLRVELLRAVARAAPDRLGRARDVLKGFVLLRIDDAIVEAAESLPPPILRSVDPIHLATAHTLRQHVGVLVVYDTRLAEAATALGMDVVSPGRDAETT